MQKFQKRSGQSGEDDRDVSRRETAAAGSRLSSGSAPCAFSGRYSNVSVLKYYEIPVIVVATKADKIPRGKWNKHESVIKKRWNSIQQTPLFFFFHH